MIGLQQRRRGERGLTLIEVLVAMALFFVLTIAVLELYAASVAINLGSMARTDLVYKCERVVETIRLVEALKRQDTPPDLSGYGVNLVSQAGSTVTLPTDPTNSYWGKGGADVLENGARYTLSYDVADNVNFWTVTVTVRPNASGLTYIGAGISSKVVRYVAQIPK
jgi:prepilin-type N-terminal cleavage/methylation domain-containing protein